MDPRTERVVRRTAMVGAATAAYFLLTADYGSSYPNPIKKALESWPLSFKDIFQSGQDGRAKEQENSESGSKN